MAGEIRDLRGRLEYLAERIPTGNEAEFRVEYIGDEWVVFFHQAFRDDVFFSSRSPTEVESYLKAEWASRQERMRG
jgi:hypothetical protein